MKSLCVLFLLTAASCSSTRDVSRTYHIDMQGKEIDRKEVYRISDALAQSYPMIIYDKERNVINIVLMGNNINVDVQRKLMNLNRNIKVGLKNPTEIFLSQVKCYEMKNCDIDSHTRCRFEAKVTSSEYDRYFNAFSDLIAKSGHPVLAVLYEQSGDSDVIVRVPFYDQCGTGSSQLNEAWAGVSGGSRILFKEAT